MGIDKVTILIFLMMVIMGWLNIYAAVYNEERKEIFDLTQRYGKQFIWIIATLVLAFFIILTDNRLYFFFAWFIYGFMIFLLLLVLVFGREINGARSWFEIGPFTLQPSEFAKFATALVLASYLNTPRQELNRLKVLFPAAGLILLPALLTAMQPDMGSTVVFFSFFLVLFREGMNPVIFASGILMIVLFFLTLLLDNLYLETSLMAVAAFLAWMSIRKWKPFIAGVFILVIITGLVYVLDHFVIKKIGLDIVLVTGLIISGFFFAYYIYQKKATTLMFLYIFLVGSLIYINSVEYAFNKVLKPHQKERVEIMLGIKSDPHGTGYNVNQSLISIGSGGLTGKGYLQGTQTKFKFVPAQSTDFIFCTVGEEWGFAGSVVVIGLYVFLLLRLLNMAERQKSAFARIYGYGVFAVLFTHFFINIGMALGLLPVIGIPLPFLSYGGSSLWGFTILLFIFLRLDASRNEYLL